jgi:hypothetical protein
MQLVRRADRQTVATHATGFDVSDLVHSGAPIKADGLLSQARLVDSGFVKSVGEQLWNRLAQGSIGQELGPLAANGRVYLDLRSDALRQFPWETLRCANVNLFQVCRWLIGDPDRAKPVFAGSPPELTHPLRVMVVVGSRSDDVNVRASEELHRIEHQARQRNADVLLRTLVRPQQNEIRHAIERFKPHVCHFVGHGELVGGAPVIRVYSEDLQVNDEFDSDGFRELFRASPPRLVVLNACLSAAVGAAAVSSMADAVLSAGCLAVVAMQGEIRGDSAVTFSSAFYARLFAGEPVDAAVLAARTELSGASPLDLGDPHALPALRANWPLARLQALGPIDEVVRLCSKGGDIRWLAEDFVDRWNHRYDVWHALDTGSSRLVVLCGGKQAGKSELLRTSEEVWARRGGLVIHADVKGATTGGWRDLIGRVADAAQGVAGVDATGLIAAAQSNADSDQAIGTFLQSLEHCSSGAPLLVAIDGMSDWNRQELEAIVLPRLCTPFVTTAAASPVRMMITLRDQPDPAVWGQRPSGWDVIRVGAFARNEWQGALEHFVGHWLRKIPPPQHAAFRQTAEGVAQGFELQAQTFELLRMIARKMSQ